MANLFKDLPHLVGTITNLDKAQSMRALESINAELKKRQRLFAKYNVNHINAYQKLFKEGKAEEPMPHLFMISDEFAELKSEQPDFMDELISTARIGRSLGVHLILATQKPAGVVNDQIWSNSNFKISLKVSDREDSMEVLKTPDAANITLPGRAYLEVGNNEMYELFQSAYSGADYRPDEDNSSQSFLIKKIDKLGQQHVISQDLSGLDETGHVEKVPTQLEAVVNKVHDLFEESGAKPLAQPWLPPLRSWISINELDKRDFREEWNKPKEPLKAVIGQVDIPIEQSQRPVSINLTEDGNLAVFASAGNGKSTFLQTLIMQLARTHTPEELNIYLLDFGTNGLQPLRDLPQVADIIAVDEEEKITKLITRLRQTIQKRKHLFSQEAVANVSMYEQKTGKTLPEIMVVIDNYEGFAGMAYEDLLFSTLVELARDGISIGVHLVISASELRSVLTQLRNSFKLKIALKQNNNNDVDELVGKTKLEIDDLPGRGLIRLEEARLFQVAVPVDGKNGLDIVNNLQKEVADMQNNWQGEKPEPIPVIPEQLYADEFIKSKKTKKILDNDNLPVGLEYSEVVPWGYLPEEMGNLGLFGVRDKRFKALKESIAKSLNLMTSNSKSIVFDTDNIITDKDEFANINGIFKEDAEIKQGESNLEKMYAQRREQGSTEWLFVYITDGKKFQKITGLSDMDFQDFLTNSIDKKIAIIVGNDSTTFNSPIYHQTIRTTMFTVKISEQSFYSDLYQHNEADLEKGQSYFRNESSPLKVKLID